MTITLTSTLQTRNYVLMFRHLFSPIKGKPHYNNEKQFPSSNKKKNLYKIKRQKFGMLENCALGKTEMPIHKYFNLKLL